MAHYLAFNHLFIKYVINAVSMLGKRNTHGHRTAPGLRISKSRGKEETDYKMMPVAKKKVSNQYYGPQRRDPPVGPGDNAQVYGPEDTKSSKDESRGS